MLTGGDLNTKVTSICGDLTNACGKAVMDKAQEICSDKGDCRNEFEGFVDKLNANLKKTTGTGQANQRKAMQLTVSDSSYATSKNRDFFHTDADALKVKYTEMGGKDPLHKVAAFFVGSNFITTLVNMNYYDSSDASGFNENDRDFTNWGSEPPVGRLGLGGQVGVRLPYVLDDRLRLSIGIRVLYFNWQYEPLDETEHPKFNGDPAIAGSVKSDADKSKFNHLYWMIPFSAEVVFYNGGGRWTFGPEIALGLMSIWNSGEKSPRTGDSDVGERSKNRFDRTFFDKGRGPVLTGYAGLTGGYHGESGFYIQARCGSTFPLQSTEILEASGDLRINQTIATPHCAIEAGVHFLGITKEGDILPTTGIAGPIY